MCGCVYLYMCGCVYVRARSIYLANTYQNLDLDDYNVCDFYYTSGFWYGILSERAANCSITNKFIASSSKCIAES